MGNPESSPVVTRAKGPREGIPVYYFHKPVYESPKTDLEMVLRAKGIDTLILCGFSTSGVVLSTVRHGADADYRLVVVEDCCADGDDEVHRVLTEKVLTRQATVTTAAEVVTAITAIETR